jgi:transcriptional regulator with PAS, ATPase and Fis domain
MPVIEGLIGVSAPMRRVAGEILAAAGCNSTVLITGESGTGKELVARAIHRRSRRAGGPFIPVNCSALPETLLEAELFGYVKGAFTGANADRQGVFEAANGGTIFLDEIGAATLATQQCLLRVLQERKNRPLGTHREREIDVRVIAATNRDLPREIGAGRFCHDLFYRLKVYSIQIPSLRDRPSDIPRLVEHFLKVMKMRHGYASESRITAEAVDLLSGYRWPGNVRELEAMVESLTARAGDGGCITAAQARRELIRFEQETVSVGGGETAALASAEPELTLESRRASGRVRYTVEWSPGESIRDHERRRDLEFCEKVLELAGYDYSKAAEWLDLGCASLYNRVYRLRQQVAQSGGQKTER